MLNLHDDAGIRRGVQVIAPNIKPPIKRQPQSLLFKDSEGKEFKVDQVVDYINVPKGNEMTVCASCSDKTLELVSLVNELSKARADLDSALSNLTSCQDFNVRQAQSLIRSENELRIFRSANESLVQSEEATNDRWLYAAKELEKSRHTVSMWIVIWFITVAVWIISTPVLIHFNHG